MATMVKVNNHGCIHMNGGHCTKCAWHTVGLALDEARREAIEAHMHERWGCADPAHDDVKAAIATARREALEEAADLCDRLDDWHTVAAEYPGLGVMPTDAAWMAGTLAARIRALAGGDK